MSSPATATVEVLYEPAAVETTTCRIDPEALGRTKGFLGVSDDTVAAMDLSAVAHYKAMSNEDLFPIGERALRDIADDIIALDEIRNRFRVQSPLMGYQNWREFVARNSKYSLRTVQRRLNEVNGVRPYTKPEPAEFKGGASASIESPKPLMIYPEENTPRPSVTEGNITDTRCLSIVKDRLQHVNERIRTLIVNRDNPRVPAILNTYRKALDEFACIVETCRTELR